MKPRDDWDSAQAALKAAAVVEGKGWRRYRGWIFESPSGTFHDLSAANLNQLERIEREGLFLR